jgi:hypothetical protein
MRLIPVCLPLVLAPLLVAGQQAQTSTPQKPAQTSTTKQTTSPSPHKTATRHRKRHRSRKAAARKRAKRAGLCSDSQFSADVIMGNEVRHVCLDKSQLAGNAPKTAPGQMKVDVINGSATDTQFFSDKNQESAHNQAVVVDVQSSDTRFAGKKTPVVTGVTSSSSVDATSVSSGGQAVTKQVSPRPKRPAYEPDGH